MRDLFCSAKRRTAPMNFIPSAPRLRSERLSHYFHARLPEQFDAIVHFDETRALEPLERTSIWDSGELPETYPFKV